MKWIKLWTKFYRHAIKLHLKQLGFTYRVCGLLTKKKRKNWKIYADREYRFYYRNELDVTCFQHDMAYGKSKDLTKRTQSDKVLTESI